ncbi:asparaginase [Feifania hominis]|uniref:asparaginase n=1 Tax=Feifania hominis TaxID=2763660 RepID=A0A926HUG0_9FIRM|nr:asparaginase [Feifania hominis]MBC8536253.1 asparaginase [Feifania hominis]
MAKRVLLLTTGGTIASRPGAQGLAPELGPAALLSYVPELGERFEIDCRAVLNLDSSNIQPEEWRIIANAVYEGLPGYDGIVVTHGTDTMAYTSSMLSFMLLNLTKPVVLTGSQLPIDEPLTDARINLHTAFSAVEAGIPGVSVAFDRKIIRGCRAVKVSTMGFDAFASVNAPCLAEVFADGLRLMSPSAAGSGETVLRDELCTDVFLLKLIPSTRPELFDQFLSMNYRGVVIEAFGAGGLHFIRRDLLSKLQQLEDAGIAVVTCSQCLFERSDFSLYEVGKLALERGVIEARDMTTEAAVTKLMWALGQCDTVEGVRRIFATNYAGEITL